MTMQNSITENMLFDFLNSVDTTFPIPLSERQPLADYVNKLMRYGTLCAETRRDPQRLKIVSLCAGYTDNVTNNMGYISVVATLPSMYGKGLAKKCVTDFIEIAASKNLDAVHLHAVESNVAAVNMYRGLGFEKYNCDNETCPNKLHLILWLRRINK